MKKNTYSRRRFLRQAAGASVAAVGVPYFVPISAIGGQGHVVPSERIVMGCIGVGGQGMYNGNAFLRNNDVQIVAVCDVDRDYRDGGAGREPAKRLVEAYYSSNAPTGGYKGCEAYSDFRDLLARDDIDAVSVCTPDHWHGVISVAAAKAGKDIYCEKPLANSIAESKAIRDTVKRYARVLQTGSHERSNDSVRFACELIRNGRIGKLHTIHVNMPSSDPHHLEIASLAGRTFPPMPVPASLDWDMWQGHTPWRPYTERACHMWWRFIFDYGGGEMTDRGAHIIDLAQLGNNADDTGPVELSAQGRRPATGLYDTFLEYSFECTYANGVKMIGRDDGTRGLRFEGTDGWIFIHIHGGRLEASPASLLKEIIGPDEIHLGRSPGHHRNFLDAVKTRQDPVAPVEVGHRTATICHLLNLAMLTGRRFQWDPAKEEVVGDPEAGRWLVQPMRSPWHL